MVHVNGRFQTRVYPGRRGVDVPAADWDTLMVLDACRADLFEQTVDTDTYDEYRRERSRASATEEWLKVNFPDMYGDTVYVTGNPQVSLHKPDCWHELVEVWQDAYDEASQVVRAEPVAEAAHAAREQFPDKRLIVHFMQPHIPFVGAPRLHFCTYSDFEGLEIDGDARAANVFDAVAKGLVDYGEMWGAYRRTLEYVMGPVEDLLSACDGRTVVTFDHGNLVSARSYPIPFTYSQHLPNHRHPELTTVPWAVVTSGQRVSVTEEGVDSVTDAAAGEVRDRLRDLRYAE